MSLKNGKRVRFSTAESNIDKKGIMPLTLQATACWRKFGWRIDHHFDLGFPLIY